MRALPQREEQRRREKEWAAQQEARKREAQRREMEAAAARQAKQEEEDEVQAQLESLESHRRHHLGSTHVPPPIPAPDSLAIPARTSPTPPAPVLRLSASAVELIRSFKRALCLNSLLEMGIPIGQAEAATDAAGAQPEAAVQMLMDGQRCNGMKEVDVAREVQVLASVAVGKAIEAGAVEAQLVVMGGNWEAVVEALKSGSMIASSTGGAGMQAWGASSSQAAPEDNQSLAPSEPDTPSIARPPWAADASSTLSAPSPATQSPRAAASALAVGFGDGAVSAAAAAAAPGVYSLADFSSSPGPGLDSQLQHMLVAQDMFAAAAMPASLHGVWQEGVFEYDASTAAAGQPAPAWPAASFDVTHAEQARQPGSACALPAAAQFGSPLAAPGGLPTAPGADGSYTDGYAAGLAAAAALLQPQQPYGGATHFDGQLLPEAPAPLHDASAGYVTASWQPQPAALHPQGGAQEEEEIDDLLKMLGVS